MEIVSDDTELHPHLFEIRSSIGVLLSLTDFLTKSVDVIYFSLEIVQLILLAFSGHNQHSCLDAHPLDSFDLS